MTASAAHMKSQAMTAPLRSTPHSQLPASQTAPVAEFRCLYTPDIRKKQKKWHDGYLKFHAFNNRVMVYDQARNFLGDTYYKDGNELHEGDELTLDKGVIVEVADAMGVTQTDLTPLFEKKPKEAPPPPSAPPRRFQPPSQVVRPQTTTSSNAASANAQLRHKSLNTLLGTPKGPIGKSVPIKSPYEARQEKEKENDFAVDRAAKRQKTTHSSTSSATLRLSSPVQEESPASKQSLPLWVKASDAKQARRPPQPIPQGAPVITLDDLDAIAHLSSDISVPSTPPSVTKALVRPAVTPAPARPVTIEKPVLQTPRIPRGKVPVPSVKALETPKVVAPTSSPPVSASNRLSNVDFAIQPTPAKEPVGRPSKQPSPPPPALASQCPPRQPKAKSLRLSVGVKRGTLMMCQPPPAPRPRVATEGLTASRALGRPKPAPSSANAQIEPAPRSTAKQSAPKGKRKATIDAADTRNRSKAEASNDNALDASDDDQEVIHGLMDQQLIVASTSPPEPILVPDSPERIVAQPKVTKPTTRKARKLPSPEVKESKSRAVAPPLAQVCKDTEPQRQPLQSLQPLRKPSPPVAPAVESLYTQSRAASPALSAVSDSRSRTASISPHKLAALSTGGFHKRSKRPTPQTMPAPEQPPTAHRNESVALPPHPLRANKKGPFMTTTELAASLQKPKKKAKAILDPIEDDGTTVGRSPERKFRRVRSENDAPIPSTSSDWEKRNLPKPTPPTTDASALEPTKAAEAPAIAARKKSGLAALVKKTDPRRKFVRTQSLNVDTCIPIPQDTDSPLVSPVVDKDIGPWSTEAFDLFDWRPPVRMEVDT